LAVFFVPRIAQDPAYHVFADGRTLLGIPNCLDVISNLPFVLVGALGLSRLLSRKPGWSIRFREPGERWPYVILFAGVMLVGLGSSYYHLAPDNERLVWDRLPMTLGFMSVLAAVVSERVSLGIGSRLLIPLLLLGLLSVLYWHVTERLGAGDLRPYALVQFVPLILIPLMLLLFPPRYTRGAEMVGALLLYGAAKLLETADGWILSIGHVVSGHTLKHLVAAAATWWILSMLVRRRAVAV
jgi:hypothetical protein